MNYKHLLLATALSVGIVSCGDPVEPKEDKEEAQPLHNTQDPEHVHTQADRIYSHLLKNTSNEGVSIFTEPAKQLVKTIWSGLEEMGFSGYDINVLDGNIELNMLTDETHTWFGLPSNANMKRHLPAFFATPFHIKFISSLSRQGGYFDGKTRDFTHTLLGGGLKQGGKYLYGAKTGEKQLDHSLREEVDVYGFYLSEAEPDWGNPVASAERVSDETLQEWNQVFIDALKEDSFFKQFFTEPAPEDSSGSVSLRAGRVGTTGLDATLLTLNGVSGNRVDLGLPVFVQLKGSVDGGKSTGGTTGVVAYRLGNTVIGAIQAYANSGKSFGLQGRQLETSVVASYSFGNFFVEGQLGTVSAKEVQFKDWSGVRSQLTLGYDFDTVSPFVQLTHRDFGDRTDTAAYAGVEMDLSQLKALDYTFNTHLLTKVGHHSVKGFTGSVEWSGSLTLNSGIAFTSHLTLGSPSESKAGFTVSFSQ